MRELSHSDRDAALPARKTVGELPWARRERADGNIRRAIHELRLLAVEDTVWTEQYRAMADAFETALGLLDAIEGFAPGDWSVRVR